MDKYLFDKYVASRFLGARINDPMVGNFMKSVKKIINETISNFLIDYASIRGYDFEVVLEAYKEYFELFDQNAEAIDDTDKSKNPLIYKILHDEFFYEELEKRINGYYKKMYDKYVPGLTEKAKKELEEYIGQKNEEREKFLDNMIKKVDEDIQEIESTVAEILIKVGKAQSTIPDTVVFGTKFWTKKDLENRTAQEVIDQFHKEEEKIKQLTSDEV